MEISWFFLAIIATLVWSVGAILMKFVRVNYIKSPMGYIIMMMPTAFLSLIFLFFGNYHLPSAKMIFYIFITAITAITAYWAYLNAIHKEEISRVVTLFGLSPLFTLILATIFLKEVLTLKDYLAFPLVITGSMLISVKKVKERFRISSGFGFILLSVLLVSISNIFLKIAQEVDFVSMMIIREFFFFAIAIAFFIFSKKARQKTRDGLKQVNKKKLFLMYLIECTGIAGVTFSYMAIQKGPVSLVTLVEGTESLFVILLAAFTSVFIPKLLKEELNKKTIALKITSALLIIGGLYLITL